MSANTRVRACRASRRQSGELAGASERFLQWDRLHLSALDLLNAPMCFHLPSLLDLRINLVKTAFKSLNQKHKLVVGPSPGRVYDLLHRQRHTVTIVDPRRQATSSIRAFSEQTHPGRRVWSSRG